MTDKIVDDLIEKYKQRSQIGFKKYGTTLEQNNHDDFINHALEEAMDLTLYLMKLKSQLYDFNRWNDRRIVNQKRQDNQNKSGDTRVDSK
jgi:hypothetical protein